jgi:RNA polymerase sigma-70 factor (ECF subfamily)
LETKLTDREAIEKVVNKDSKALEALYDKYSPILFTLIKKILADKSKAENVLADIFVIIWQKSDRYDLASDNLYTWLVFLARNKSIDFLKRERGEINEDYTDEYENQFIIPTISTKINSLEIDEAFNTRDIIYTAINNLTEAQQYVLSLAYYQGLKETEIAEKLNIPLPTVKTKLRVVLNSIKESMMKEGNR